MSSAIIVSICLAILCFLISSLMMYFGGHELDEEKQSLWDNERLGVVHDYVIVPTTFITLLICVLLFVVAIFTQ